MVKKFNDFLKESSLQVNEKVLSSSDFQFLICTKDGSVETLTGEARSAEVLQGQQVKIIEDKGFYFVCEFTKEISFRHDAGLSGKAVDVNKRYSSRGIQLIIRKERIINDDKYAKSQYDDWAEFQYN